MKKIRFTYLLLVIFVLGACQQSDTSTKETGKKTTDHLTSRKWKLNDAQEKPSEFLAASEYTSLAFTPDHKFTVHRQQRGNYELLVGEWRNTGKKLTMDFKRRERVRQVEDLNSGKTKETTISNDLMHQKIDFDVLSLEQYLVKIKNDSLQYILVPHF